MAELILPEESYQIVGLCMEIHRQLGMGFKEIIYKDALEIEFRNLKIPYQREKKFEIRYKGIILPHRYYADFIVYKSVLLEIKSTQFIIDRFVAQTINYLKASGIRLGIIINFGEKSLTYKRIIF